MESAEFDISECWIDGDVGDEEAEEDVEGFLLCYGHDDFSLKNSRYGHWEQEVIVVVL